MNADDRNPNQGGQPSAPPASAQEPVRRAGVLPPSGSVPQRTAFRPITGTHPTTQQPAETRPIGAQPTGQPTTSPQSPTSTERPTSFSPAGPTQPTPRPDTAPRPDVAPARPASAAAAGATQAPAAETQTAASVAQEKLRSATAGLGRFTTAAKEKVTSSEPATSAPVSQGAPRKVRVLLSRIDPWSALKIGFLLSIAAGIMMLVAVHVLWTALNSMGTFELIQEWVSKLFTKDQEVNILQFVDYKKVMSASLLVSVTNVVLISGLSVISAFLYNMVSRMVGGVYVTLTDD
ncbi:MAG: hypothetical protein CVT68_07245 [Actinobacteria bacterium HGW-Actinobacteria-8]|nr:MAG: hypothetical protein CVT68_07245 [Actinobacteria bacterium HGW-Actinobacteria-8]